MTTSSHHHICFYFLVPLLIVINFLPDTSSSRSTCINNAKTYLKENPTEKVAHIAQIFHIQDSTLCSSIKTEKKSSNGLKTSRQNKILKKHQVGAIIQFIQSLLTYGIQPSYRVVFGAIIALKHTQNPHKKPFTERWFRLW